MLRPNLKEYIVVRILILALIFFVSNLKASTLSVKIVGGKVNSVKLISYKGFRTALVKEVRSGDVNAVFNVSKLSPGLYQIDINSGNVFDVILNKEDVEVVYDLKSPDNIKFLKSVENKLYLENIRQSIEYSRKLNLITAVIKEYPEKDKYYKSVKKSFVSVQKNFIKNEKKIIKKNRNTYFAKLLKADRKLFVPYFESDGDTKEYLKENYYKNIEINDTALIYSNILTIKVRDYFNLISDGTTGVLKENKLIEALDNTMKYVNKCDIKIKQNLIAEINDAYTDSDFNKFYSYFAKNYLLKTGGVDFNKKQVENRITSKDKFALGKVFPDFYMNVNNQTKGLIDNTKKYKLVVFWALEDSNSDVDLLKLKNVWSRFKNKNIQILTFSLDVNKQKLLHYMNSNKFTWVNYCDFKGWNSPIVDHYALYKIPLYFILDNENKIISKPKNFQEMVNVLNYTVRG